MICARWFSTVRELILVLTMHHQNELVARTLKAGVRAFVLKFEAERDLIPAIEAVMQNHDFISAVLTDPIWDDDAMDRNETEIFLTVRESEVVQLVAEGKSNEQIAAFPCISTRTAENHRARIMAQLGLHSLSELVRYAIRNKIIQA